MQILKLSFFIYALAVGLNMFFDVDLATNALAISFGSAMLFYVSGNKIIMACDKAGEQDICERARAAAEAMDGLGDGEQPVLMAQKPDGKYRLLARL
jgi:hypothetical protein